MRLGFCGLGQMGEPMARRLLAAGHELVVWNRTSRRADALVSAGARCADGPAETAAGSEAVVTMLATPEALEEVVFGRQGIAAELAPGATLIEMSTVGPAVVTELRRRLRADVGLVDAPVLGSVPQATDGTLRIFVGGTSEDFASWGDVLEAMGEPVHLGPLGAGAAMKIVVNSTLGAIMGAVGEALVLADALGIDERAALDVLAQSPVGATIARKRDSIESGRYQPAFKLALARKDMDLVASTADGAGVELRLAPAARSWIAEATEAGLGALDYSAVIAHIRGRSASG
jgi:3-hydroxyisobutyrate dehydrogenase-like beta-hydroxyacid dehydrogenase